MDPYGSGIPLVVDSSAWARQHDRAVRERWELSIEADVLTGCPVVALELLAGARGVADYDDLAAILAVLRQAPVTASVCRAALEASRGLVAARPQPRRVPAADYLIAAAAAERGFGVLHYDRDYDLLASVLAFESVWVAPPGSIA